jgi:hypothetical protein
MIGLLDGETSIARCGMPTALGRFGETERSLEPKIVQWIEHHQDSEHVGGGIDALWKIVEG